MHAIRLNLLENTMNARFLCTTVYCLENWKECPVCMCLCSCLNSMLFLERNVDIGMHAIRLNLLENIMDVGFLCTIVYCLGKLERITNLHVLCSCLNNMLF